MKNLVFVNNQFFNATDHHFSSFDRSVHFGDAIYETIFYHNKILMQESHLKRMERCLKSTHIPKPKAWTAIPDIIHYLASTNSQSQCGYSFIAVSRGPLEQRSLTNAPGPSSCLVQFLPSPFKHKTVHLVTQPDERWKHPNIKSISLLPNVLSALCAPTARLSLLCKGETVTEGTHFNICIYKDGSIITPPPDAGILEGCTRSALGMCAAKLSIPFKEEAVSINDCLNADAVIGTSSLMHIANVATINEQAVKQHPIVDRLRKVYNDLFIN